MNRTTTGWALNIAADVFVVRKNGACLLDSARVLPELESA